MDSETQTILNDMVRKYLGISPSEISKMTPTEKTEYFIKKGFDLPHINYDLIYNVQSCKEANERFDNLLKEDKPKIFIINRR